GHPETSPGLHVSASWSVSFRWHARPRHRRPDGRGLALDLEEHASERAVLDEVPKRRRSGLKRECLRDDRLDLARLEKFGHLHPCFRDSIFKRPFLWPGAISGRDVKFFLMDEKPSVVPVGSAGKPSGGS